MDVVLDVFGGSVDGLHVLVGVDVVGIALGVGVSGVVCVTVLVMVFVEVLSV